MHSHEPSSYCNVRVVKSADSQCLWSYGVWTGFVCISVTFTSAKESVVKWLCSVGAE